MSTRGVEKDVRHVAGFLFVGDPHLTKVKPGRRKDEAFAETVLGKIEQCIEIANKHDLVIVLLGDLFDRSREEDETIRARLFQLLRRAKHRPISNTGNHDLSGHRLMEGDSLYTVWQSGLLEVADKSGPFGVFQVGEKRIGIGMTPYGQDIPEDVRDAFSESVDAIVWITHHDIAFEGAYPGSSDPHEIRGCGLVVNGHMHLSKKVIKAGTTTWFNPGNILRQHVDAKEHVPAAFQFDPVSAEIYRHVLDHQSDIFDLTGYHVSASSPGEAYAPDQVPATPVESAFAEALAVETATDMDQSDDGSLLMEEMQSLFQREEVDAEVQALCKRLHSEVTSELQN